MADTPEGDWVARFADEVIAAADRGAAGQAIVVRLRRQPVGPDPPGQPARVPDPALRRRGDQAPRHRRCAHLHSWDDYDRFRKVPAGVDPSWAEHIGRPLSAVPDPWAVPRLWAEHFKEPLLAALARARRRDGADLADRACTAPAPTASRSCAPSATATTSTRCSPSTAPRRPQPRPRGRPSRRPRRWPTPSPTRTTDDGASATLGRFPFKPYCRDCGRDTDHGHGVRRRHHRLSYTCACAATTAPPTSPRSTEGKLVWKVDWPMRWAFEHVDFEPAGMDHATPGSSFTVGGRARQRVFGSRAPSASCYAFVGFAGMQKMSSLGGRRADRRRRAAASSRRRSCAGSTCAGSPNQTFNIDFGPEVRAAVRRVGRADRPQGRRPRPSATRGARPTSRASRDGRAARCRTPVACRSGTLASVADVTAGQPEQISRICATSARPAHDSLDELEPRLTGPPRGPPSSCRPSSAPGAERARRRAARRARRAAARVVSAAARRPRRRTGRSTG